MSQIEIDFLDLEAVKRHYGTLDLDEAIDFLTRVIITVQSELEATYGSLERWNEFTPMDATQRAGIQVLRFARAMRKKNAALLELESEAEEETSEDPAEIEEQEVARGESELSAAIPELVKDLHGQRHSEGAAEPAQQQSVEGAMMKDVGVARQVLMSYFMLKALGFRFDIHGNKKRAITLISALVNRHPQSVKNALGDIGEDGNGAEPENLEYVLALFREAGIGKVAEEIEKNLQK